MEKVKNWFSKVFTNVKKVLKENPKEVILEAVILVSLLVMIAPYGYYKYHDFVDYPLNGYAIIFGYVDQNGYVIYNSSLLGLIFYGVLLVTITIPFLKKALKNKLYCLEFLFVIAATVLFFLLPTSINHASESVASKYYLLPVGYIAAGIYSITVILCLIFILIEDHKIKKHRKEIKEQALKDAKMAKFKKI